MTVAASAVVSLSGSSPGPRHCHEDAYERFVADLDMTPDWRRRQLRFQRTFVRRYPDLDVWFDRPLRERVGWRRGEYQNRRRAPEDGFDWAAGRINHNARNYLLHLALTGAIRLDWGWLFGIGVLRPWPIADALGLPLRRHVEQLLRRAAELGLPAADSHQHVNWAVPRMLLHRGVSDLASLTIADADELRDVLRAVVDVPQIDQVLTPDQLTTTARVWATHAFHTGVLLYHAGIIDTLPERNRPKPLRPVSTVAAIATTMNSYLAERALSDRPATVGQIRAALLRLSDWLTQTRPDIKSLAELDRPAMLEFLTWIHAQAKWRHPEQPLSPAYRRMVIHQITAFFRNTAQAGWASVPARSPLTTTDIPRTVARVPRFIPDAQLDPLMDAIRRLECPLQRAALLVARWSGARRSEIGRLHLDCLDTYPDGTHRLRLAAGKSRKERVVPIHPEAADAVRALVHIRRTQPDRPIHDDDLGRRIRYLFLHNARLASPDYLFAAPLRAVCAELGLVTADGKSEIHPHRFRHTIGTQLGERGAKIQTIMKVLGHRSAGMSMTYTSISDPVVLADYQAVLQPGAVLAGPQAAAIRSGELTADAVNWLKTNFYKTELELGRCLRLPQEGPCECDLYLSCSKFVTTPDYVPRLRSRLQKEGLLVRDAEDRGWPREVERHRRTADRIRTLLEELGEPTD